MLLQTKTNRLNWGSAPDDDRLLYLQIMRDLEAYCAKGYCEIEITLFHFVGLPNSLIQRELKNIGHCKQVDHFVINWYRYEDVHRFFRFMIEIVCELNHQQFNSKAFNEAVDEKCQKLKKLINTKLPK